MENTDSRSGSKRKGVTRKIADTSKTVDASTRKTVDASTRKTVDASTRKTVECAICCETITKKRFLIECPFCLDGTVCVDCGIRNVLYTESGSVPIGERGCVICDKKWDLGYIEYMFGEDVAKTYTNLCKNIILEREKSKLPSTQKSATIEKLRREIEEENKEYIEEITKLRRKQNELNKKINDNYVKLQKEHKKAAPSYIKPCPVEYIGEDEDINKCKGYISSKDMTCSVCSAVLCKKCHFQFEYTPSGKKKRHICNKNDIETVKSILKDTKACPKCATRIQKIDGCSQMFCTHCHTAFNWNTLEIVRGHIHNPHYQEYINENANRAVGDIRCGGLPELAACGLTYRIAHSPNTENLHVCYQYTCEIIDYLGDVALLDNTETLFENLRINYILDDIKSEDDFAEKIMNLEKRIEKFQIEIDGLTTLIDSFGDSLRNMKVEIDDINRKVRSKKFTKKKKEMIDAVFEEVCAYFYNVMDMINDTFREHDIPELNVSNVNRDYQGLREKEIDDYMNNRAREADVPRLFFYDLYNNIFNDNIADDSDSD